MVFKLSREETSGRASLEDISEVRFRNLINLTSSTGGWLDTYVDATI